MSYILESQKEFKRLEEQSKTTLYDYRAELKDFKPESEGKILDAGCGSGVVTRYLAELYPKVSVFGCDGSDLRIQDAKRQLNPKNCIFKTEELGNLSFRDFEFDAVVCRYVLEHIPVKQQLKPVKEMFRCLKTGGQAYFIDIDGYFYNLFPRSEIVSEFIEAMELAGMIDLNIGRKIPNLMVEAGFANVTWSASTMSISGENLEIEAQLIKERFENTREVFSDWLGSKNDAVKFENEYLKTLRTPGSVLFYNKFIVQGEKLRSLDVL